MAKIKRNKLFRYFEYKVLHIDDSPHKIALGLAIGLFVAWTPLLGLHIILAIALTMLLRANKFAALVSIWVSNVFTFFIIYYPCYIVGKIVMGVFSPHDSMSKQQVSDALNKLFSPGNILTGFYSSEYWKHMLTLLKSIGPELWVGCFLVGSIVAVISYLVCYKLILNHRIKSPHRRYKHY